MEGRAVRWVAVALLASLAAWPAWAQAPEEAVFERRVRPVLVYDSTGAAMRFPFLGGFNRPRPQLVDIDADGDRDFFVQERGNRLLFFENDGASDGPLEDRLTFRSAEYRDLDVGQWYRFADLDGDGDFDLLAEAPRNYVRYYQNTGTPASPSFALAADTLRTVDGAPIFADRRNRPAAFRANCEDPPSLMFGGLDGRLRFFRHVGVGPGGVPQLRLVSEAFQDVCAGPASVCGVGSGPGTSVRETNAPRVGPGARPTLRHGANALAAGDLDGDGDDDLLWGDFFSESFYRIENGGTCDTLALRITTDVFPAEDPVETSGFNAADLADLEGDGDADVVFGVLGGNSGTDAIANLYLLEQTADGFVERTRRLLSSIDVGSESAPVFADLDGDGDEDLIVGAAQARGGAPLTYFENTADARAGNAVLRQRRAENNPFAALPGPFSTHPAFADVDGDGDLDLALGAFGSLALYENTGTRGAPQFAPDARIALPGVPSANYYAPTFADIDGDGDADLLIGTSGGTLALLRNTGASGASRFVLATTRFAGIDVGSRAAPALHDADGDADLDLYVGSRAGLHFFENTGAAAQPLFADGGRPVALVAPALAVPAFTSVGDGPALVVGSESGGAFYFARREGSRAPGRTAHPVRAVPNPFREATTLRFQLEEAADVRLVLYDARGRRVASLFAGYVAAGQRVRVPLRAAAMASGVYFFHLTRAGGEVIDTGSVVLVR